MLLGRNENAMKCFSGMTDTEKEDVIRQAQAARSTDDIAQIIGMHAPLMPCKSKTTGRDTPAGLLDYNTLDKNSRSLGLFGFEKISCGVFSSWITPSLMNMTRFATSRANPISCDDYHGHAVCRKFFHNVKYLADHLRIECRCRFIE